MAVNPGTGMIPGGGGLASANEFYQAGGMAGQFGPVAGQQGFVYMGPNFRPAPSKAEQAAARSRARSSMRRAAAEQATGARGIGGMPTQVTSYIPNNEETRSYAPIDAIGSDAYWLTLKPEDKERFRNAYRGATGSNIRSEATFMSNWRNSVIGAANFTAQTGRPITPWEYMELLAGGMSGARGGGGGGGGVSRVVDLTNPSDAQVLVDNALNSYLGRRATEEELGTFLQTLNKAERANPVVTTPSGRTGGVNRELVAREFAESRDEAAEFMVESQYMNWFEQLLNRDVTEGIESGL